MKEALSSDMDGHHLETAAMAGGSRGGIVARRFAIDHPERTVGLVLWRSPDTLRDNPGVLEMESTLSKMMDPGDPGSVRGFVESPLARVSGRKQQVCFRS